MQHPGHIPVLLDEVMACLRPQPSECGLDGTLGCAGHASCVAQAIGPKGRLVGIDQDADALAEAERVLRDAPCEIRLARAGFQDADAVLDDLGWDFVDIALLDLGFSSLMVDRPERGFSFRQNGKLDMRMDDRNPVCAGDMVNTFEQSELTRIIGKFGEERHARRVARAICKAREEKPIATTFELRDIIHSVLGSRSHGKIDPATRTFQGLRMAVNDEIGALEQGLETIWGRLAIGGRLAVIAFHSLEDRIVKRFIRDRLGEVETPPGFPVAPPVACDAERITQKPIRPSEDEIDRNRRARSAKLRALKKIAAENAV